MMIMTNVQSKTKQNKKKWLHDEYKVKSWVDDKKLNHRP